MAPDDRRKAILDVLVPLIVEKGGDVSTREIARAAGIAEGTIFRVFPDKKSLMLAAAEEAINPADGQAAFDEALAGVVGLRAQVVVATERVLDRMRMTMSVMMAVRQHLMALHIITLYRRLKNNPHLTIPPRAFIFGGKAAPGYFMAKRIIKLITAVGATVNNDPAVNRFLKVVFLPNFNVKSAHLVYPAANLSEQISTAGKEASGTGNMKFMINGALTIGTLDGANVEIREEAGPENFFLFGLTEDQVEAVKREGYRPMDYIERDPELAAVLELIVQGTFTHGDTEILRPVVDNFIHHDSFLALADYRAYVDCQRKVSEAWQDRDRWSQMSILNTARSGKFSSDRAIEEYCDEIWNVSPMPVEL